jgi:hypothetical protein
MVIVKKSMQPLEEGYATIFDVVGNIVAERREMLRRATDNNLYFHWTGRNRQNRAVGAGSYLVVIETTKWDGTVEVGRVKIGVSK